MNTRLMGLFPALLLGLVSFAAWSQQPASSGSGGPPQGVADQGTSNTPLKTADGVSACPAEFKFSALPPGVTRVGGSVLPPKAMYTPDPTFSDEARKYIKKEHIKNFDATSVVSLTVDTAGKPQDICVVKEAGHGLDREAFETVAKYRFQPATRNEKPVAVRVMVQVRFQTR